MECHHWTSVWAWADKLARPKARAVIESLSFMRVPERGKTRKNRPLGVSKFEGHRLVLDLIQMSC
jgi:hypothetical protein